MNTTALHQTASGKWVPCRASQRACPRKSHVKVFGDPEVAADFFNALDAQAKAAAPTALQLTPATVRVLEALENAGLEPYVVGGSVRDAVLGGVVPKDMDIEVYGGEVSVVAKALRTLGRVDEVGKSFGVLKLTLDGEEFDISLPRRDSKVGDGHRGFEIEVDPNLSLEEASSRRDYTINALMYSHREGRIIDLHGGLNDLREGHLRHVSDAFDEDPLRVLRGVQMAARFKMDLHPSTIEKAVSLRDAYTSLAVERVQIEFQKLYEKGVDFNRGLKVLRATGWDRLFPGLAEADEQELHARLHSAQQLVEAGELPKQKRALILSALVAGSLQEDQRPQFLRYTTVDGDTRLGANALTTLDAPVLSVPQLRHWIRDLPRQVSLQDWHLYQRAINNPAAPAVLAAAEEAGVLEGPEPDLISGNDLISLFPARPAGPWRRTALDRVRAAQYAEQFRTRDAGLRWMESHAAELG